VNRKLIASIVNAYEHISARPSIGFDLISRRHYVPILRCHAFGARACGPEGLFI